MPFNAEPVNTPAAASDQIIGGAPIVDQIRDNLSRLTGEELLELDRVITPRAVELLVKAFGSEMRALLEPLAQDSEQTQATKDTLEAMVRDRRYWDTAHPEHKAFVAQVTEAFRIFYDAAPAPIDATGRRVDG